MKLAQAKREFISTWGTLATRWNINPTMGAVHALLLISADSMDMEEIMKALELSRGGAYTNIEELLTWGLIKKQRKAGKVAASYEAEKDMWKIIEIVIRERKKRELDPLIKLITTVTKVDEKNSEAKEFTRVMKELKEFTFYANNILEISAKADKNWFFSLIKKIIH